MEKIKKKKKKADKNGGAPALVQLDTWSATAPYSQLFKSSNTCLG